MTDGTHPPIALLDNAIALADDAGLRRACRLWVAHQPWPPPREARGEAR